MTATELAQYGVTQTHNSASAAIMSVVTIVILHICLMEWCYPYRRYMQRKLRTISRRIQLTETDHE